MALIPSAGRDPCAALPSVRRTNQAAPRSAVASRMPVGSATTAASALASPAATSALVPCGPSVSSSAANWKAIRPHQGTSLVTSARAASSAAEIAPFMSQEPRPCSTPSATTAS